MNKKRMSSALECDTAKLQIEKTSDNRVILAMCCNSAYEAAILYDDIARGLESGELVLDFTRHPK